MYNECNVVMKWDYELNKVLHYYHRGNGTLEFINPQSGKTEYADFSVMNLFNCSNVTSHLYTKIRRCCHKIFVCDDNTRIGAGLKVNCLIEITTLYTTQSHQKVKRKYASQIFLPDRRQWLCKFSKCKRDIHSETDALI
ncbi:MAG: hypothetical protein GY941_04130 [Planctomycetes bacterium]|nr:hypothetical protein [Planctomycetota bacterium]